MLLSHCGGPFRLPSGIVSQGDVQEYVADRSFEADNQRLGVFAALRAVLGSMEHRRMHAKMESLIVQRCDRVANHLIGQFADGFAYQVVRLRQLRSSEL